MNDFTKQQSLERLGPLLVQLGADPKMVLEEVVRVFQLPDGLAKVLEAAPAAPAAPEGDPTAPLPE